MILETFQGDWSEPFSPVGRRNKRCYNSMKGGLQRAAITGSSKTPEWGGQ